MHRALLIAILLFLATFDSISQVRLRGRVVYSKKNTPLPQAAVFIKGARTGVQTAETGEFMLNSTKGSGTLVFRYLGFITKEVPFSTVETEGAIIDLGDIKMEIGTVCYVETDLLTLGPSYSANHLGFGFKLNARIPPVFNLYPRLRLEADFNARTSNSRKYFRVSRYSNYIASGLNLNFDLEYASRQVIISDQSQGLEEIGLVTSLYKRRGTFGIGLGLNRARESQGQKDFALILEYYKELGYHISVKTQLKKWHEHTQLRWKFNYSINRINLNIGLQGEHLKNYNEFILYLAYDIRI
ncbi:hypothetical protein BFP97_03120 [Roseivirga sp. 4D4]|uniref:carboxypeptidase-like regulatory domain-containing protein n=1 Tax=Roseivirga sp. 4D4 TaxID=1889784 RepID=UPI0008537582|nr:carboxypeptidase-like regulatory domain-containing protein [Roseivirga sp. 4D4]OEK00557.1 hypothetical protein BFP97_03120 [Roseivirga sp. 4D4]